MRWALMLVLVAGCATVPQDPEEKAAWLYHRMTDLLMEGKMGEAGTLARRLLEECGESKFLNDP